LQKRYLKIIKADTFEFEASADGVIPGLGHPKSERNIQNSKFWSAVLEQAIFNRINTNFEANKK